MGLNVQTVLVVLNVGFSFNLVLKYFKNALKPNSVWLKHFIEMKNRLFGEHSIEMYSLVSELYYRQSIC